MKSKTPNAYVVLVGNGPVKKDHSRFIDSCQTVVRFNACNGFGGLTGEKVDVLCLATAHGRPAPEVVAQAPEFWFSCGARLVPERMRNILEGQAGKRAACIYQRYAHTDSKGPSSGYQAYLFAQQRFIRPRIALVGFTWEGWEGHDWAHERVFFAWLLAQNQIEIYA